MGSLRAVLQLPAEWSDRKMLQLLVGIGAFHLPDGNRVICSRDTRFRDCVTLDVFAHFDTCFNDSGGDHPMDPPLEAIAKNVTLLFGTKFPLDRRGPSRLYHSALLQFAESAIATSCGFQGVQLRSVDMFGDSKAQIPWSAVQNLYDMATLQKERSALSAKHTFPVALPADIYFCWRKLAYTQLDRTFSSLRDLYSSNGSLDYAWADGWRWLPGQTAKSSHRFYPPLDQISEAQRWNDGARAYLSTAKALFEKIAVERDKIVLRRKNLDPAAALDGDWHRASFAVMTAIHDEHSVERLASETSLSPQTISSIDAWNHQLDLLALEEESIIDTCPYFGSLDFKWLCRMEEADVDLHSTIGSVEISDEGSDVGCLYFNSPEWLGLYLTYLRWRPI